MTEENLQETEELVNREVEKNEVEEKTSEFNDEKVKGVEELIEVDFSTFVSPKSIGSSRSNSEAGALSIVNSENNGRRMTISKKVLNKLNFPMVVKVSFSSHGIAIGEDLPAASTFHVRKYGAKGVIYSSDLIQEITDYFELDFNNRVSITFHEVKYSLHNDKVVAIIRVD